MKIILCTVSAIAFVFTAAAAIAQDDSDLDAAHLRAKFMAQSQDRGLQIVPSDDAAATDGATALPADTTYASVAPESQVNFQIKFAFDSAALAPDQLSKLTTLCEVIKTSDIPQFKIIGHTDASGADAYNQNLSLLRAQEVKRRLIEDCSVPEAKLLAEGVGEGFPLDPANPRAEVNRRVEFQVGS